MLRRAKILAENHFVIADGIKISDDGSLFVPLLEVEKASWIVGRQRGRFDQEKAATGLLDVRLDVREQFRADAAGLHQSIHEDPIEVPGPIGPRRGSIVDKRDRSAVLFKGERAVPPMAVACMVVVQDFFEGFDFEGLKDTGALGYLEEDIGFGFESGSDHSAGLWTAQLELLCREEMLADRAELRNEKNW